jgi:hypothetical protein
VLNYGAGEEQRRLIILRNEEVLPRVIVKEGYLDWSYLE